MGTDSRLQKLETDSNNFERRLNDLDVADVKKTLHDLQVSVARIEGALSIPTKPPHAWVTPAISAILIAFVGYLTWIGVTVSRHESALAQIRQSLLGLGITIAASNPSSPKAQEQARTDLSEAVKDKVTIPESTVVAAGKAFIDASNNDQGALSIAAQFVSYRSMLNKADAPKTDNLKLSLRHVRYGVRYIDGKTHAGLFVIGNAPSETAAELRPLSTPAVNDSNTGHSFLVLKDGATNLDGMLMRHVAIEGVEVHYSGEPVSLEDVTFIDCKFVFTDTDNSRELLLAILSSPKVTIKVGNPTPAN